MKKTGCRFPARWCGSHRRELKAIAPPVSACSSTIRPTARRRARRSNPFSRESWRPNARRTRCERAAAVGLKMSKRYFGTDGIRGRADEPPNTADFLLKLGRAAGRVLAREDGATMLIGKDTRISGYMLE